MESVRPTGTSLEREKTIGTNIDGNGGGRRHHCCRRHFAGGFRRRLGGRLEPSIFTGNALISMAAATI